ncbi:PREDICTED: reticulon-like protein B16 isoform X1 [Lupinus angustifolius]|uniref:reticulon-like protein B16 isoform X1 n=1 Tax=Lupinus angustifolius TaxID=3871 RepID=UPI00092E46C6|nr:PREDICTED: reticulon-like protein B16 isoform X1 [Lupinus angustifolius]
MSESEGQPPTAFVTDVLLWKRWHVSLGIIVVATVAWFLLEWTDLPFLTICSDVLLILILVLFLHANYAALRNNRQPPTLPELVVTEELVNTVAASFRVKINNALLIAHDITIGKDFRIFFKVVVCLWLLSVIGSVFSFFTLAYIGTLMMITIPALYRKYGTYVDKCCGVIQDQFSKHYRIVDENVFNTLPRNVSKDKES